MVSIHSLVRSSFSLELFWAHQQRQNINLLNGKFTMSDNAHLYNTCTLFLFSYVIIVAELPSPRPLNHPNYSLYISLSGILAYPPGNVHQLI